MGLGINEILGDKRDEILRLAAKHGANNVRVFGSVARGEAALDSDVDFLVQMENDRSLLDLANLVHDLEDFLERKVHVVEPESVYWYIRERVLKEAVPL